MRGTWIKRREVVDGARRRGNYFGGDPIRRMEIEVRVRKLKNRKTAGKDEATEEMIKGKSNRVVNWIWRMCNIAFESGVVLEDWRSTVMVPLYKGKKEEHRMQQL